uniref:Uncharacterized protein n=1 Tax=Candidatus Kentrum sp. LPFa TaxID=2126335 RepID=A0A450WJT8_9GAMM|nr:MAG: hypothetical protein BECKLPF1236A_GA0070988_101673 [Candidatus Kentron sp. LPFa]VFK34143.1 MAG: hypothetical protein BECKLPF1236C_GA0070990_102476 [Candidatus Kentron sp. LPFa]
MKPLRGEGAKPSAIKSITSRQDWGGASISVRANSPTETLFLQYRNVTSPFSLLCARGHSIKHYEVTTPTTPISSNSGQWSAVKKFDAYARAIAPTCVYLVRYLGNFRLLLKISGKGQIRSKAASAKD